MRGETGRSTPARQLDPIGHPRLTAVHEGQGVERVAGKIAFRAMAKIYLEKRGR